MYTGVMVSHVVVSFRSYEWVECLEWEECVKNHRVLVHDDSPAEFLNSQPQPWVEALLGFSVERFAGAIESIFYHDSENRPHRDDGPALAMEGKTCWYRHGVLHRENGPAVFRLGGNEEWYRDGKLHRADGPAVMYGDGGQEWFLNGEMHRDDGPAATASDKTMYWYQHGKRHRVDGPAVMYPDGSEEWWVDFKPHRVDGPAIKRSDGTEEWWLDGVLQDG